MPPKKTTGAAKKTSAAAAHPPYSDMIKEAIISLKERNGSSRQALKKYVLANNNLGAVTDASFTAHFNQALMRGSDSGVFARPKGPSGPVKLAGPKAATESKVATTKTAAAKAPAKAKATKTAAATKAPAAKKAKTTNAKEAPGAKKATATKSKANTSKKVRKTPVAAPAVEEKAPVVLGKTKSGRVTKSTAPQAVAKAIAPKKKAAPKKAAAKKATPKKA